MIIILVLSLVSVAMTAAFEASAVTTDADPRTGDGLTFRIGGRR